MAFFDNVNIIYAGSVLACKRRSVTYRHYMTTQHRSGFRRMLTNISKRIRLSRSPRFRRHGMVLFFSRICCSPTHMFLFHGCAVVAALRKAAWISSMNDVAVAGSQTPCMVFVYCMLLDAMLRHQHAKRAGLRGYAKLEEVP